MLTPQQIQALEALEWLLDNDRRSGRTYVQALALLRYAGRHPETWVRVRELTVAERDIDQHLLQEVVRIAMELGIECEYRQRQTNEFRVMRLPLSASRRLWEVREGIPTALSSGRTREDLEGFMAARLETGSELQFSVEAMYAALGIPKEVLTDVPKEPEKPRPSLWDRLGGEDPV